MPIDYKKYPPNWKELVKGVLLRANNRCEQCELKNRSTVYSIKLWTKDGYYYKLKALWFRDKRDALRESGGGLVKDVKVVLTVAHLDHDEGNWEVKLERLKALCQICHLRYDAKEKWRRELKKMSQKSLFE